jgi:hypothetical protein
MVAVRPDATNAPKPPVDPFRQPDAQPLHPATECPRPVRLDEEVHVIRLHGEVHHAERGRGARREATTDPREESVAAQRG